MYHKVDLSVGFGTYHISPETLRFAECILARKANGRTVNSIFGEGVNPRMRKIRDAVEEIDLPVYELLQHQNARVVYGIALAHNFPYVLLGRTNRARYILPQSKPKVRSALIANYWRYKMAIESIRNPEDLQRRTRVPVNLSRCSRSCVYLFLIRMKMIVWSKVPL